MPLFKRDESYLGSGFGGPRLKIASRRLGGRSFRGNGFDGAGPFRSATVASSGSATRAGRNL
jgi:hypothetical protein